MAGRDAVQLYKHGIVLLNKEYQAAGATSTSTSTSTTTTSTVSGVAQDVVLLRQTIRQQVAAAHSSIAELYMTDLCFEPDAEVGENERCF